MPKIPEGYKVILVSSQYLFLANVDVAASPEMMLRQYDAEAGEFTGAETLPADAWLRWMPYLREYESDSVGMGLAR